MLCSYFVVGGNNLFIFIYDALCIRFVLSVFICSSTGQRSGLVSGTHLRAFGGSLCRNRFIYLFPPKRDHIGEPEKSPFFGLLKKFVVVAVAVYYQVT